jgi:signal transduction histidine kinase
MPPIPRSLRPPTWVLDVAAGVLVVLSTVAPFARNFGPPERMPWNATAVTLALCAAAILPLRRRWPIPVLAGCLVLFLAATGFGVLNPAFVLPSAIAVWNVGTRRDRRTTLTATILTATVLVASNLLSGSFEVTDPRYLQYIAIIGFAGAFGDAVRSGRAYIAAITERAEHAEATRESEARRRVAEDRLRIARELHDAVAHQMAVINLHAGVASQALPARPDDAERSLATIREAARTVLREISELLAVLRADSAGEAPPTLDSPVGLDRLDTLLADFARDGLQVTTRVRGVAAPLPPAVDAVAYRIIQEALTNAHKHGSAHAAELRIDYRHGHFDIEVENPVAPRPRDAFADASGHGLVGIVERAGTVNGAAQFGVEPAGSFRLNASLPLAALPGADRPGADLPTSGSAS